VISVLCRCPTPTHGGSTGPTPGRQDAPHPLTPGKGDFYTDGKSFLEPRISGPVPRPSVPQLLFLQKFGPSCWDKFACVTISVYLCALA
jgi:hypothetical protein